MTGDVELPEGIHQFHVVRAANDLVFRAAEKPEVSLPVGPLCRKLKAAWSIVRGRFLISAEYGRCGANDTSIWATPGHAIASRHPPPLLKRSVVFPNIIEVGVDSVPIKAIFGAPEEPEISIRIHPANRRLTTSWSVS